MSPPANTNYGRDQNINHGHQYISNGPLTVNNQDDSNPPAGESFSRQRRLPSSDNPAMTEVSVLERLLPHIAPNAIHNAKARANRHECLPGTRTGIIGKLGEWIEDPANGRVQWVSAGAGVGKTAIAQTLCQKYAASLLAASHFFSRNDSTRDNMDTFVLTIAYQLASCPVLGPHLADAIDNVLRHDPNIVDADWGDQFERLVSGPCSQVDPALWKTLPRLVIIDGLDECMDTHKSKEKRDPLGVWEQEGQAKLLAMIKSTATASSTFPLRFMIFSRPERTILSFFETHHIAGLKHLDITGLHEEAREDIQLYLRHEFARVRTLHPHARLDESWPGEKVIGVLTTMSDGQFIYVVTVIKYITEGGSSLQLPQVRLEIVLHPTPSNYPNLSALDQLYHLILEPLYISRKQLLPALQLILGPPSNPVKELGPSWEFNTLSLDDMALVLKLDSRQVSGMLSRL
ncbi:hypothetical protein V5O48_015805, partial [Marasmius crinis-equi]